MGSGNKITDRKRPSRILDSGDPSLPPVAGNDGEGGGGGGGPDGPLMLVVPLVRVDGRLLLRASVGDPVALRDLGNAIAVFLRGERVGDVAPEYEADVRSRSASAGVLRVVERSPVRVHVLVR